MAWISRVFTLWITFASTSLLALRAMLRSYRCYRVQRAQVRERYTTYARARGIR